MHIVIPARIERWPGCRGSWAKASAATRGAAAAARRMGDRGSNGKRQCPRSWPAAEQLASKRRPCHGPAAAAAPGGGCTCLLEDDSFLNYMAQLDSEFSNYDGAGLAAQRPPAATAAAPPPAAAAVATEAVAAPPPPVPAMPVQGAPSGGSIAGGTPAPAMPVPAMMHRAFATLAELVDDHQQLAATATDQRTLIHTHLVIEMQAFHARLSCLERDMCSVVDALKAINSTLGQRPLMEDPGGVVPTLRGGTPY